MSQFVANVPTLFQWFTIATGDSVRHRRDKHAFVGPLASSIGYAAIIPSTTASIAPRPNEAGFHHRGKLGYSSLS
jgi:hypothetical protein